MYAILTYKVDDNEYNTRKVDVSDIISVDCGHMSMKVEYADEMRGRTFERTYYCKSVQYTDE